MNVNEMFRLDGKTAVVTGGGGRFGRQICRALCEAGARVSITYCHKENQALTDELTAAGCEVESSFLDLGSEESIISYRDHILEKFRQVDILVNNAVVRAGSDMAGTTREDWETTSKSNSLGLFLICKYFLEVMSLRRSGSIINIGSIQSCVGPNFPVYGDTGMTSPPFYTYDKWGMVGLTKYIANFYGKHGIRCNCISPGGFLENQPDEFLQNYQRLTPLGRMAGKDDLKGAVVFFASDASQYVTGQNLPVDGGWTSW